MESKTRFKYGSYAVLTTIVIIAIFLVLNLIISEQNWSIDFTQNKLYSLSDTSKQIVSSIGKDIKISFAHQKDYEDLKVEKLLQQYKKINSKIAINSFSIEQNEELATKYNLDKDTDFAAIILECDGKTKVLGFDDIYTYNYETDTSTFAGEQTITTALKNITTSKKANIYAIEGHGEVDITDVYEITEQLKDTNYTLKTLKLEEQDIPNDADIIMLLSPETDLTRPEIDKLSKYMNNGGRLFFTLYPGEAKDYPVMTSFLNSFGLTSNYNLVMERNRDVLLDNYGFMFFTALKPHDITNSIINTNYKVIVSDSTYITPLGNIPDGYKITSLLQTSDESYSKDISTLTESIGSYAKKDNEPSGPFSIAVSVEKNVGDKEMKAVVLGCLSILDPTYSNYGIQSEEYQQTVIARSANQDVVYNSLAWLKDAMDEISIRPKAVGGDILLMTQNQVSTVLYVIVIAIPLTILFIGFIVWYRRKKRV